MIIELRKSKALPDPIIINDHTLGRVSTYEYLGVVLNNDPSWSINTDYIISKQNSSLYCLRKLKKSLMLIFVFWSFFISWLSKVSLHIVVLFEWEHYEAVHK